MKTKKTTGKFVSVLSVILALTMLSTTVFASGVLSGLTEDNYIIEITNNGEVIELVNKPFIENGEVYVPLRETFEKVGVMEHPDSKIEWNNGKIELTVAYYDNSTYATQAHEQPIHGQEIDSISLIYSYALEIGKPSLADTNIMMLNAEGQNVPNEQAMSNAPVLRSGNTYIPYSYINYLLKNKNWNIGYAVYNKDGNPVDSSNGTTVITSQYENTTPEYTVNQFFKNVELGQKDQAQQYCADWLESYHDYSEFFQPQKIISDIKIDYTKNSFGEISAEVYTESSNADIGFIHWKLFLIQTDNDQYLINGYESITDVIVGENGNLITQF